MGRALLRIDRSAVGCRAGGGAAVVSDKGRGQIWALLTELIDDEINFGCLLGYLQGATDNVHAAEGSGGES